MTDGEAAYARVPAHSGQGVRSFKPPALWSKFGRDSYEVEMTVRSLKHGFRQPLNSLWVTFGKDADLRPFPIDYKLVASNIPGLVEGRLHVVVEPEE